MNFDYTTRARLTFLASDAWTVDVRGQFGQFSGASNEYSWVKSESANDYVDSDQQLLPERPGRFDRCGGQGRRRSGVCEADLDQRYNRITEVNRADLDFSNPVQDPGGFLGLGFQVGQGQDLDDAIYSEELRLTSQSTGPLRWVGGLSYQYSDKTLQTRAFVDLDGRHRSDRQSRAGDRQQQHPQSLPVTGGLRRRPITICCRR